MATPAPRDVLHGYVQNGRIPELTIALESNALLVRVGKHADAISRGGMAPLFVPLQRAFSEQHLLALAKLYDPSHRKYEVQSIPGALDFMERYAAELRVEQRLNLVHCLAEAGMNTAVVASADDAALTRAVVTHFKVAMPAADPSRIDQLSKSLVAVKTRRDKSIAHSEAVKAESFPRATWGEIRQLLSFAERFLDVLSFGYFSLALAGDNGRSFLEDDAQAAAHKLQVLLLKAGVIEYPRGRRRTSR